jgi:HEAT repeat protein
MYRARQGFPIAIMLTSAWQAQGLNSDLVERWDAHKDDDFGQLYPSTKRKTFLLDLAWDCVETIATLRSHRIPEPQEAWQDVSRSEKRLLSQIDAILSCGREIVLSISEMAFDPDLSDPDRVYAILMVIGCVDEEIWIRKAVDILQRAALNSPEERLAAIEAMCLIPHPRVREFLAPLLDHHESNVRAAALEILAYRGQLGDKDVMRAINDSSPQVLTQVAANLDRLETSGVGEAHERLLTHSDEQVVRSAFYLGVWQSSPRAKHRMYELCMAERGSFAEAIVFLALLGDERDLAIIRSLIVGGTNRLALRAAGYFGHPDLIPLLTDVLRNAEEEIANETAVALNRITGANLTKTVEKFDYEPGDQEFFDQPPPGQVVLLPSMLRRVMDLSRSSSTKTKCSFSKTAMVSGA